MLPKQRGKIRKRRVRMADGKESNIRQGHLDIPDR
jgi:hypothetical protein